MKKRILAVILSFACAFAVAGCAVPEDERNDPPPEDVDKSRTQLYVYNYNGGYGSEWLTKAKTRYEELHKNDSYEEGKQGVQIMPVNTKNIVTQGDVKVNRTNDIYFCEGIYYDQFRAEGAFADITQAVTGENPYETGKTIESKLTSTQKDFYGVESGGTTHYYAIPHYSGYYGIIYNVDLFDKEGYYFAETPSGSNLWEKFIDADNTTKSKGPDGKTGIDPLTGADYSVDDGLPATYEEFYELCTYIKLTGNLPFVWTGQYYELHLMNLYNNLVANYEGVDNMMKNYTFSGTADDLGTIQGGAFVLDGGSGTPLSASNGYETKRQAGKYYALEFLERIISEEDWQNREAFSSTFSHTNAQSRFIRSVPDSDYTPTAMLIDGSWWQAEASSVFNSVAASFGEEYSMENANYAWMPLPRANASKSGDDQILFDHLNSLGFVNANSTKKELAIDFLQFVNTDESLVEFTQVTNTVKALNYTLTAEEIAKLNPYGQSLVKYKQAANTKVVYPLARNSLFVNNQSMFNDYVYFYGRSSTSNVSFAKAIFEDKKTAAQLFKEHYEYYEGLWSTLN